MTNEIQDGRIMEYSNSGSAISSGDVVVIGEGIGIAITDIAATTGSGSVQLEGVFELDKVSGTAFSQGDRLFWSTSSNYLTKTATGNKYAGIAFEAAGSSATSALVKLEPDPKQATVVTFSAGSNLSAAVVATTTIADSNFTAANAAEPTKAEIDVGINTLRTAVVNALDLKADNADLETMRGEIETRLDALDTAVAAILSALKASGHMANS